MLETPKPTQIESESKSSVKLAGKSQPEAKTSKTVDELNVKLEKSGKKSKILEPEAKSTGGSLVKVEKEPEAKSKSTARSMVKVEKEPETKSSSKISGKFSKKTVDSDYSDQWEDWEPEKTVKKLKKLQSNSNRRSNRKVASSDDSDQWDDITSEETGNNFC